MCVCTFNGVQQKNVHSFVSLLTLVHSDKYLSQRNKLQLGQFKRKPDLRGDCNHLRYEVKIRLVHLAQPKKIPMSSLPHKAAAIQSYFLALAIHGEVPFFSEIIMLEDDFHYKFLVGKKASFRTLKMTYFFDF